MSANNSNQNPISKFFKKFSLFGMYLLIGLFLCGLYYQLNDGQMGGSLEKEIPWNEFQKYVEDRGIQKIEVITNNDFAVGTLTDSLANVVFHKELENFQGKEKPKCVVKCKTPGSSKFDDYSKEWKDNGVYTGEINYIEESDYSHILWNLLPILLLIGFWVFIFRRSFGRGGDGGIFGVGKSRAKMYDKENSTKVTFEDVAGLSEAKT